MDRKRYNQGLALRREMLGGDHVDRSMDNATDFDRPFQDLVNEFCYGALWARPDLPRSTRSLVNIGLLCALNKGAELRMHLRAALRNGASRDEIREVLLQVALYCGMPAGRDAFATANEVFKEIDDG
jgi:4-carboxymuconolactone decarboxylase